VSPLETGASVWEISIRGPFPQPPGAFGFTGWKKTGFEFEAEKAYLESALVSYFRVRPVVVVAETNMPGGLYNIRVAGPPERGAELTAQFLLAVKNAFGIVAQTNTRAREVYAMTFSSTNTPGMRRVDHYKGAGSLAGGVFMRGLPTVFIAGLLSSPLDRPVVCEAVETNSFWDGELHWEMTAAEKLEYRLVDQRLERSILNHLDELDPDDLPPGLVKLLSGDDLAVFKAELRKPASRRFKPDPGAVLKAAREQLGIELKPVVRQVNVLELRPANPAPPVVTDAVDKKNPGA
jgi:hypothetical protein